ncbi:protein translocase subunit SecD [Nocardiopsis ansamitocini]|uniref:Multifunctional fusion protein n=1 Tax=Nocardiopsis ansamitocini TaxID=1670832 RepID=A0A9W6P423_9ACTN|nr:protein translocase subunit SecD [Nocardiopsis ansamitocini]GLU46930.1 protein translocase subunit SecDF [Nocardiopsis ansamitocini]
MSSSQGSGARVIRGFLSLFIVLGALAAGWFMPPKLGLDLSGGTQIILETQDGDDGTEANAENTDKVVEVLRNRIDALGVSEATMSRSGENRVIVELPGVQDPTEAAEIIGQTAQLTFHPVLGMSQGGGAGGGLGGLGGDSANAPADESNAPAADGEAPADGAPEGMSPEDLEALLGNQGGAPGAGGDQPAENPADVALTLPDEQGNQLQLGKAVIQGDQVASASAALTQFQDAWVTNLSFRSDGREAWAKLSGDAACFDQGDAKRRIAIVLDNKVISAPVVQDATCGVGYTTGTTSISNPDGMPLPEQQESSQELATLIEGGSLPLPVTEVQRQTVGPTLGAEAIQASFIAGGIGILLTALYICVAYRFAGFLASLALICYTLIAYAAMVALGATLTLPGLAGFVLAIGMAIDANVLIFERAREEYQRQQKVYASNKLAGMSDATDKEQEESEAGVLTRRRRRAIPPSLHKAFVVGTQKAWSAVLDTNITTLIAAALLFFLASGNVQGFGVTLGLGTIASMVSALLIARVLMEWVVARSNPRKHYWILALVPLLALIPLFSGLALTDVAPMLAIVLIVFVVALAIIPSIVRKYPASSGIANFSGVRTWLVKRNPDLMKRSALWLGVSGLVAVVAVVGLVVRSPNYGVEFTGGRVMEFAVSAPVSVDTARQVVADAGFPEAVVQESGDGGIAVRTGQVTDAEAQRIQDSLEDQVNEETDSGTGTVERLSDEKIGPSMGNELRNKAIFALIAALVLQMGYLAWRFRWSFGLATMIALAFDIVVVIGLFAWLGKPIDGVFLAAILSVIGFSVNDSVVVFDRVRDEWAHDQKSKFSAIANQAILHTLPRTVNSGIGGIFILATLAIFGGSSLTDFSIAMLVGLVSGMFSTVFVGTPLAIWLQKYDRTAPPHVVKEKKTKQRKELREAREESDGAVV